MKRIVIACTVPLLALVADYKAFAQSPYAKALPPPRPIVSPYLNLFRSGNSAAFNYTTLVRPELEFQKTVGQLGKQVQQLEVAQTATSADTTPDTGHRAGFQTHGRYFMSIGNSLSTANPTVRPNRPVSPTPTTPAPRR